MNFDVPRRLAFVLALLLAGAAAAAERPDLVVVISIDQFRYEYLERFAPYFAPDGFRRFLDRGANFTSAYFVHSNTITGPGHASIGTGYPPSQTGIVGNDWLDRTTGKTVYCVEDPRVEGGFSPVNLQADSLGDRVLGKYPDARVYGVAVKDRASILMAGRRATAAYWFEPKNGGFKSSGYYRGNPTLTANFNKTLPQILAVRRQWIQSSFIPAADLDKLTHDPESLRKFKTDRLGLGVAFPHPIGSIDALTYTPFGNQVVIGFSERLIETERLGANPKAPDLLFVGLSSPDYLGHFYGPDSLEVADSCVRTDRDLAAFFAWLDQRFKGRYTVALSADHGVQSMPSVARELGRDAGRVDLNGAGADRAQILAKASTALGSADSVPLIAAFEEPSLYLDWKAVAARHFDGENVKRAIRDAALGVNGVAAAFTNTELMIPNAAASGLELAARNTFRADRSGDLLVLLKPGYMWGNDKTTGTTHGQPVEDDQHVPLLLWGLGVKPGRYAQRVAPTDLARSLGSILGVDAGASESRILPAIAGSDLQAAIRTAIAKAPRFEHLIAGAKLQPAARLTTLFDPQPADPLPEKYARLERAEVDGNKAVVTLWYGPIPKPQPGVITLACGTGYTYQMERDANGEWVVKTFGVAQC